MASTTSAHIRPRHQLSGITRRGFTYVSPYCFEPGLLAPGSPSLLHPSSAWFYPDIDRYGNVDPLSIDYAFRPRLRIRLTLEGIALSRKPWVYGEADSHCFSRYSCPHTHSNIVQQSSQSAFTRPFDARLPRSRSADQEQSQLRFHT